MSSNDGEPEPPIPCDVAMDLLELMFLRLGTEEKNRHVRCRTITTGVRTVLRDTTEDGHYEEPKRLLANIQKMAKAAGEIKHAISMAMNSIVEAVPTYAACQSVLDPMFVRDFALELTCAKTTAARSTRTRPHLTVVCVRPCW